MPSVRDDAILAGRLKRLGDLLAPAPLDRAALENAGPLEAWRAPASFMQRRLWFVEQIERHTATYNLSLALVLEGPLDVPALEDALAALVNRHEAFRTRLVADRGVPVQVIAPTVAERLERVRVEPLGTADDDFTRAARAHIDATFDLAAAPPWRVLLIERAAEEHCLLFVYHHAIADGASVSVLLEDLSRFYASRLRGETIDEEPPALQFAEFAAWQHVRAAAGTLDADVDYWVHALKGAPGQIDLGADLPAGTSATAAGLVRRSVDADLVGRLRGIAAEQDATLFAAGLAAWAAWLRRRGDVDDVVIGTPSAGRRRQELRRLIGPCINTLTLRLNAGAGASFADLVRDARRVTLEGAQHEDAPIERVLERLRPDRRGAAAGAQLAFLRPMDFPVPSLPGLVARHLYVDNPGPKADLSLELDGRGGQWSMALEYRASLFSAAAAREALDDFVEFTTALASAPGAPLRPLHGPAVPLTPGQLRMWFDQQRVGDAPLYNVATSVEIEPGLDVDRLETAFRTLVETTDALRLSFDARDGVPRQRVREDIEGTLARVDLRGKSEADKHAFLHAAACEPFDLRGPLFHATLATLDGGRLLFLLVAHHLIIDGWSVGLVFSRLGEIYNRANDGVGDLPAYPSFADHARLAGGGTTAQDDVCRADELDGISAPRFFGARVEKTSTAVTRTHVPLGDRARRLLAAAQDRGSGGTQGAFLLMGAALVGLLHRLTGDRRLAIGVPFHNRHSRQERGIAGLFMDVIPLAVDCSADDTPDGIIHSLEGALRRSVRRRGVEISADARARACDVLLNVHASDVPNVCGVPSSADWVYTGHEHESLSVQLRLRHEGPYLDIDTHDDVFDQDARSRIVRQFLRMLDVVLDAPATRIGDVALMDAAELEDVHARSRGPMVPEAYQTPVLEQILRVVADRASAPAIVDGPRTLSYGDLRDRVERIASALQSRGTCGGDLIGVAVRRSPEFVSGILGVLGAGAAYLPLDPDSPAPRLDALLAGAGASHVITGSTGLAGEWGTAPGRLLPIAALAATSPTAPLHPSGVDDLAYVIYTSGSTGTPKGVEITHRGLANYATFAAEAFGLSAADRVLHFAALTFDTAVEEIFPTLLRGATLVLRDDAMLASPAAFIDAIDRLAITVVNLPTSYWHTLAAAGVTMPPSVRLVIVGGDAMRPDLLARWQERHGSSPRVLNGYGPTEATVVAVLADVTSDSTHEPVCIGRPIWNTDVYVVDATGALAPPRHAGELLIAGPGVARGYRGDPGLTASRFVAHPAEPGGRAYRTGDLARRRPDGALEFLGRLDDQVKVRGFRVEPAEIASRLRTHPDITDAVVTAERDGASAVLNAYVRLAPGSVLHADAVRAHVREQLPDYMVPERVFTVGEIPRTSSGKVDRERLRREGFPLAAGGAHVEPSTRGEQRIAQVWRELLKTSVAGIHDNFFDTGGQSLLAAQLAARISAEFGVDVPPRTIFEHPTIAALARFVESHPQAAAERTFDPGASTPGPAPMSFGQERLWFAEHLLPGTDRYVVPSLLRLTGDLSVPALEQALSALVARHPALRTTFEHEGDAGVQIVHEAVPMTIERLDLTGVDEPVSAAEKAVRAFVARPFDLTGGPLFRTALLQLGPRQHWLVHAIHHAVFDGWSGGILRDELAALYNAARAGKPAALPQPRATYAQFARWQRQQLSGASLDAMLGYWRERLSGAPETRLERDREDDDPAGAIASIVTDADLLRRLAPLSSELTATPFMMLAAALALVLGRLSGQADVVIGVPVAGRTLPEFDGTVGFFLNTVPLRVVTSDAGTPRQLVALCRDAALGAFAHQDLPFERLVEELAPDRAGGRNPYFDVLLNFVGAVPPPPGLDGLDVETLEPGAPDAKFPLTIYALTAGDALSLKAVYRRRTFAAERIAALMDQVAEVLSQFAASPDAPLESVSLVTASTQHLLADPSVPLAPEPFDTVATTFAAVAARTPHAIAVQDGTTRWSYSALAAAAGDVQRDLDRRDVPTESRVAVIGHPGGPFLAALLGVIGSGRIVVPVDASIPASRRAAMLAEVAPAAVLEPAFDPPADGVPLLPVVAGDAAYIFFTSGTTGEPRGVLGSHRGLAHFLAWERRVTGCGPGDRVAQVTSPSFDVFLREALLPVTSGATLVVARAADGPLASGTLDWFASEGITLVHAVPTLAQFWLDASRDRTLEALRCTLFAGEPLPRPLVERWHERAPHSRILNLYGPTETTLAKCWYEVDPLRRDGTGALPVGTAMDGAQAVVLRGDMPCGISECGEIVIRTPYRSHGYLREAANAGKFVRNPFVDDPRDLLYRTGDRGRVRWDGNIVLDGRFDEMTKIRGVRVDAAEVAAVLASHPRVNAAAVIVDRTNGEPVLVAGVATRWTVTVRELYRHIERRLPSAARPTRMAVLDTLPRTANGKLDRAALLAQARAIEYGGDVEPLVTPTERSLAELWRELLGAPVRGRRADFFDAGGHSLLAARLVNRIKARFGIDLPLRTLFEVPMLADVAAEIDARRGPSATAVAAASAGSIPRVDRNRYRVAAEETTAGEPR